MAEQNNSEAAMTAQILQALKEQGQLDISPCDSISNIEDNPRYKRISLSPAQKMQMSALVNQLPAFMAAKGLSNAALGTTNLWMIDFPMGIQMPLVSLKNGGFMNMMRSPNGQFAGFAPLYNVGGIISSELASSAIVYGTISAVSTVVGQYHLAQINSELKTIQKGMDKILEFLYGEKRAELMAEVSFTKYAYENYSLIAAQDIQKAATIASLQGAKKVAMKDAEFYISDLESTIQEGSDIERTVEKACQIHESLDLALQLCVMSSILEVYYSGNFDKTYLAYIENDVGMYIDKCEKYILSVFAKLHERVESYKPVPIKKVNKEKLLKSVSEVMSRYNTGIISELRKTLYEGLYSSTKRAAYYLGSDGSVYVKTQ